MPKKNLIEEALIEAKELERASIENAKNIVLESFAPDFVDFFKDVLNEEDHKEPDGDEIDGEEPEDDIDEGDMPDFLKRGKDDEEEDDELEEGNEHDMGKEPDPGRQGTDPAVDDSEETLKQDDKDDPMKEGKYDDVSGDPTPEKGQAGLPKKGQPKTKKVGKTGWEDEGTAGYAADDPEKTMDDVQGGSPKPKQTGDGGWEEEHQGGQKHAAAANAVPGREGLSGTPKPKVKIAEADDDEDEDKELDVPDELFDDEKEESPKGTDENDNVDIKDDFDGDDDDVEINIDVDDDEDDDSVDEGADPDMDYDEEDDEKEEVSENLYVRKNGQFKKITPAEYLTNRIDTLVEENDKYEELVKSLQGQLQETHLFNAKLAHLNKLFMTGAFTNSEKEHIAEKLDECNSIDDVKSLYKTIISEVQDTNPLDEFSNIIKEQRIKRSSKAENIYESEDVSRMKRLINYSFD